MSRPGAVEQLDDAARKRFTEQWAASIRDTGALMEEVKRLYAVLGRLRDRHLPFAGTPGDAAFCGACSLHGAHILWPCEIYLTATAALPERKP